MKHSEYLETFFVATVICAAFVIAWHKGAFAFFVR
jgi:hypothetical protein